jgi:hypothetical protein
MFNDTGPGQAAGRLSDLYETAHRLHRIGARVTSVAPAALMVSFRDHRVRGSGNLMIEPWPNGEPGWYWYADISLPDGFTMGPLSQGRRVLDSPRPRQVVRGYGEMIRYELRPMRRKTRRTP